MSLAMDLAVKWLVTFFGESHFTLSIHSMFVSVTFTSQSPFTCKPLVHTRISNTWRSHLLVAQGLLASFSRVAHESLMSCSRVACESLTYNSRALVTLPLSCTIALLAYALIYKCPIHLCNWSTRLLKHNYFTLLVAKVKVKAHTALA